MITGLRIRDLGVIEAADLDLGEGLTVLTGETGAGKTMVLTSLQLLAGQRADPGVVRVGSGRAEVDGVFEVSEHLGRRAGDLGADVDDGELIISRTVAARGRSRAHLGGRPVPVSVLAEIGDGLVTIHGQADQMRLRQAAAQRETLDAFGGSDHDALLASYRRAWQSAVEARRARDAGRDSADQRAQEAQELEQAVSAIDALDLRPGEDEELRAESSRLASAEDLRATVGLAHQVLVGDEDEPGVLDLVGRASAAMRDAVRFDASLGSLADRLEGIALDVDAAGDDTRSYLEGLDADPLRLAEIHERRAALRELMAGRAADAAGLLGWREQASRRLQRLRSPDLDPDELEAQLTAAQDHVLSVGRQLSEARRTLAAELTRRVDRELAALAMRGAHIEVRMDTRKPGPHGLEDVSILMQAHPSLPLRPLGQGASGGELSRIMLALEVVLGEGDDDRCFVFDEVDAGVGGRTATEVGRRLARLARTRQVLVVTHLAQVAAFADAQFVVEKSGATTTVRRVTDEDRVAELARMMGGDTGTDAARRHALELIEAAAVSPWDA